VTINSWNWKYIEIVLGVCAIVVGRLQYYIWYYIFKFKGKLPVNMWWERSSRVWPTHIMPGWRFKKVTLSSLEKSSNPMDVPTLFCIPLFRGSHDYHSCYNIIHYRTLSQCTWGLSELPCFHLFMLPCKLSHKL